MQVMINGKNLSDASSVQHLMYPLRDHPNQFFFVAVPQPKHKRALVPQLRCECLIALADLTIAADHPLQEEVYLLLIVAVHFLGDEAVVLLEQLIPLLSC